MRYEKDQKRIDAFQALVQSGILIPYDNNLEVYNNSTNRERIMPYKDGSYIFNSGYSFENLNNEQKKMLFTILKELSVFPISELAPVTFEQRDQYTMVYDELKKLHANAGYDYITNEMCSMVINNLSDHHVGKEIVRHVAGAMNAKMLLIYDPDMAMKNYAQSGNNSNYFEMKINGENITLPITHEYIASWLYNNNIIGAKGLTVKTDEQMSGVYIFDSKKVGTEKEVGDKIQSMMSDYGEITKLLENFTEDEKMKQFFKKATPQEMIEFGKGVNKKYKTLLEGDAGNWEGYSVEEHTEAVLRNFEDAFGDDVPEELYPFIKFMMLTHDLGKSKGRYVQKAENAKACAEICKDLSINPQIEPIIQFIIGDSQRHTTNYFVMKDPNAQKMLLKDCEQILKGVIGQRPNENLVNGLAQICKILQTCDSGAYTAYGVIRDSETGVYYRGGNYSWTKGFKEPKDPRRKADMRFSEPDEKI